MLTRQEENRRGSYEGKEGGKEGGRICMKEWEFKMEGTRIRGRKREGEGGSILFSNKE